jgi:hypothetical protein
MPAGPSLFDRLHPAKALNREKQAGVGFPFYRAAPGRHSELPVTALPLARGSLGYQ